MVTDVWPLFGLVLRTPRLELRSPSPEQLAADRAAVRLDRQTWAARQAVPVEIEGLEPCRELLGAVSGAAAPVPGS